MKSSLAPFTFRQFAALCALFALVLSAFAVSFFISPLAAKASSSIFSDSFENTPAFSSPSWTISDSHWGTNSSDHHTGSKQAKAVGNSSGSDTLQTTIDTTGYENLTFSFWYKYEGLDGAPTDSVVVEWYDGSTWHELVTFEGETGDDDDVDSWTEWTTTLPSGANNNSNFAIRFVSEMDSNGNDKFYLDDVLLTGDELPSVPDCDLTSENPGFTTFDTFSLGNVDGQNSWSSTKSGPSFDQEVVENIYGFESFGCKSLRLSNAVTSGSFGDQTFAAPVADTAGETGDVNHFEAQFDIASTQSGQQSGLAVSVSPDDGNGSRMSYLSFADEEEGIRVTFYDVTDSGPLPTTASFNPTDLGLIDRSTPHTIKFVVDFVDGPANDVVEIYIDGSFVHTGTTWEDYYRYDSEQNGNGNVLFPIDTLIFRAGGTAAPDTDGKGYLFDNLSIETSLVEPEVDQCTVTQVVVSDELTGQENGLAKKLVTSIHAAWTAVISGASWIWSAEPMPEGYVADVTKTFTRTFTITGVPLGGTLEIAADNSYTVKLNDEALCDDATEYNYTAAGQDVCTIDAEDLAVGVNTLEFTIKNWSQSGGTISSNPAGLLYKLTINEDSCEEPEVPQCELGVELLTNGGFEHPVVANSSPFWNIFPSGTSGLGWVVAWLNPSGAPTVANLEIQRNGLFAGGASEGNQWAELDADWDGPGGSLNGEAGSIGISQTVLTAIGETYTFSFDFSPRPNTAAAQNKVEVLVNGDVKYTAGPTAGSSSTSWTQHSFSFVADTILTTVTLRDAGTPNDSLGTLIDNASLMCSEPEPEDPWCSFAGKVIDYSNPAYKNSGAPVDANRRNPAAVETVASYQNIGGSEGSSWSTDDFFSLGINGWLIYEFTDKVAVDQSGDDIAIYEITGNTTITEEKAEVWVSQNGVDFVYVDTITGDGSIDISGTGLDYVKYVKLVDDSAGIQGSGGDGYDVDAIVILNGSCADEPEPQFATVTLCKLDTNENALAGWTLSLLGDQVDEVNVPANTLAGADSTSLNAGTPYVAFASGVWLNNRNPDNHVDAEYSTEFGNTNTVNADWTGQTIMDGFIGYGANILDLQVNDQFINWGAYNSTHEYAYAFTPGVTDAVNFRIFDGDANTNTPNAGWYGDNSGSLNVDIYKGYAGVTDEQSGCVVFEQVPLGSYTVSELAQQGWQNVSGLGSVTVDEGQETFNVVNVELDTITVEKWSDEDQDGSWDENENGVAGWDMVVKPETLTPVSEFTVSSASQTGTDSSTLTDGRTYLVEVSGTYQYAGNSTKVADAGFYSTNNWSSHGEWGSDNPSEDQRTLNLIVDDAEINWGTYNSDHLYKALLTGDDAAVNFRVFERQAGHYPDNIGDLTVRIYDVTDYVVTTGENGSATLEVLPGEYQVVEMQREGWTQTAPTAPSYCHIDTTDDSDHTCTFGNYETPTAPDLATLVGTKIVCDAEQYLPNWGTGAYGPITATTATDWLAEGDNSKYCHLESGWEFEWVTNSDSSSNPGDNVGAAGSPWTSTGLTAGDGTVSTQIPAGERVWVREVLKDGFIGFAGQTTQDDDSAELYCSTDVLNYDNWDYIDPVNTDETYYCVAWNAPVPGAPELTIVKETESYDDVFYFGVSANNYEYSSLPSIETENGYGQTTLQLPVAGTYNVLELLDEDWVLSDVWCEYNSESEVGSPLSEQDGYEITLEDGDQVTCYFYNEVSCALDTHFDQSEGTCVPNEGENYFDLAVDKTVAHDGTPAVGETVTYTIHLTISGDSNAGSIYVYDLLPSGVTYQSHTASNGNENYDEESGEWYIAGLTQGGEGATLTITATINNGEEGQTITNTATISDHDGVDTNSENNSDGASFTVEDDEEEGGGTPPTPQTFLGGGITGLGGGNGFVLGASTERLGESCGLYMDRFLRYGYPGNNAEQVEKLQQFLNKHGFGALNITGIFGIDTENAVKKFQQTYANEILTPWGLNAPTGLVYITTLRQINLIECPQLSLQVPELIAWSLANGASVADSLTGNGTQSNGGNTGGSDDSGSENNQDQAASVGGAVKGQGFWNRVWNFFFKR